ncbi:helix-turn-helix transcriptional regulator [Nocardia farcinica]|uniref:helix-turn-helix transcriptional regulator n=1 Tax=Nocardia farcinica TaxID=37329 RepID=UPI00379A199C
MTRRPLRGFDRERLIDLRTEKGYTRGDLARFAEVSVAAVRSWESGQATPQVDRLARVANALEVPLSDLVRIPPHERYLGDLRVQAGLTQPQLALEIGISTASLSSLELGETALRESVAERLGKALGLGTAEVCAAYERSRTRPPGTRV